MFYFYYWTTITVGVNMDGKPTKLAFFRSKLVPGLTNDLLTDKNYLQACKDTIYYQFICEIKSLHLLLIISDNTCMYMYYYLKLNLTQPLSLSKLNIDNKLLFCAFSIFIFFICNTSIN